MKKFFKLSLMVGATFFALSSTAQNSLDVFQNTDREYYLIYIDDAVQNAILANPKNLIKGDWRINDVGRLLYIWNNTYTSQTGSGNNFYGGTSGYMSLVVNNEGWSGAGFTLNKTEFLDLTKLTGEHVLHIGVKSTTPGSHLLILGGGPSGSEGKVAIGDENFIDAGTTYVPYTDFTRDGNWNKIEIPISEFINAGFTSPSLFNDGNYFAFLSGGVPNRTFEIDAIYIYKENIPINIEKNKKATELKAFVSQNGVSFIGAKEPIQIYSVTGALIKTLNNSTLETKKLSPGLYIAKSGNQQTKFIIR